MTDRIAVAKTFVKNCFSVHCTYDDIRHYYSIEDIDGYAVSRGAFRTTFIPFDCDFVIKTGHNASGSRQCAREMELYNEAKADGFGRYVAKCYGSFRYHNHLFYVYERVSDIDEGRQGFDHTAHTPKQREFLWWCYRHYINDLHGGNYGRTKRGFVLVDYAGYHPEQDGWI